MRNVRPYDPMRDLAMVPDYEAIHGRKCCLEDLIGLVKQYALEDWLLHLSRLATLLAGGRHRPGNEYGDAYFQYIVPSHLRKKVAKWFQDAIAQGARPLIHSERHVGILMELALLHAPGEAPEKLGPQGQLFDALLTLVGLDNPAKMPQNDEDWAAVQACLWDRSRLLDPSSAVARGFHLYQIAHKQTTKTAQTWAELFHRAMKTELHTYFLGGLGLFAMEFMKKPEDIAKYFAALPETFTDNAQNPLAGIPHDYLAHKCATTLQLKQAAVHLEGGKSPNEYNLVPVLKYPLFRSSRGGAHCLFLSGVAGSLCEGIYQEVMTASVEGRISGNKKDVGAAFGHLFEEYVLDLLDATLPSLVVKRPRRTDSGNEAADGVVIYPEGVIVLEIKGSHVRAKNRMGWKDYRAKADEVAQAGLVDAVDQFVDRSGLLSFRKGRVRELAFTSPNDMVLQPVVVMNESVPLAGPQLPIIRQQRQRVALDAKTRPLIIMDVREVEALCSLPPGQTMWQVLTQFIRSPGWEQRHLANFLHDTNRLSDRVLTDRWKAIMPMLREKLGIGQ